MGVRTRVLWTLSATAFDESAEGLGRRLVDFGVAAILTVFDASRLDAYHGLRRFLDGGTVGESSRHMAFLFSLTGRRAFFLCDEKGFSPVAGKEFELPFTASVEACLVRQAPVGTGLPCVVVSSLDMLDGLKVGTHLSFGYGEAEGEVLAVERPAPEKRVVRVRLVQGDALRTGFDVTSPDIPRGLFPLLPSDAAALGGSLREIADGVIVQGIASEDELRQVRSLLGERSPKAGPLAPLLLFRVDSAVSLALVPRVIDAVDGIHLNRSELGVSIDLYDLPQIQKDLIAQCNRLGEVVMVSSDLMASMRRNPNPTRAEVSDLANLVVDGVDALVIGREVSEGPYPAEAAHFAQDILADAENALARTWGEVEVPQGLHIDALAFAALHTAEHVGAKAIVCLTRTGYTAGRLSSLHAPIDLLAATSSARLMRQVSIMHSMRVLSLPENISPDAILPEVRARLVKEHGFSAGDKVVVVSLAASTPESGDSNLFVVEDL